MKLPAVAIAAVFASGTARLELSPGMRVRKTSCKFYQLSEPLTAEYFCDEASLEQTLPTALHAGDSIAILTQARLPQG